MGGTKRSAARKARIVRELPVNLPLIGGRRGNDEPEPEASRCYQETSLSIVHTTERSDKVVGILERKLVVRIG